MSETQAKREQRLAEIDREIAAATQWGAYLTALNEERAGILRTLAAEAERGRA